MANVKRWAQYIVTATTEEGLEIAIVNVRDVGTGRAAIEIEEALARDVASDMFEADVEKFHRTEHIGETTGIAFGPYKLAK